MTRLPPDMISRYFDDAEWRSIRGMRNRIAHAYAFVDPAVVRGTLLDDVAGFEQVVVAMLDDLDTGAADR